MNAYEIEQIEKQAKVRMQLPLSYVTWADIERRARAERARMVTGALRKFFAAAWTKLAGAGSKVRSTAADCTSARLRHN